jgi:UDP-3-O-[3-hydroxymyristoyl] glucosamine N-acyltransferase
MKFNELITKLEGNYNHSLTNYPNYDPEIFAVTPIENQKENTISYIEGAKFAKYIDETKASALILPDDEALQKQAIELGIAWISSSQPRLLFAQIIKVFYTPFKPKPRIHPTAIINPGAKIGENTYIGPHVVIETGVKIGANCCIFANVVIYPQVEIGANTTLHANCSIHERSVIGANCVIHSGAVIGSEGFGFVPTRDGWFKMEQSGRTVLEDGVEVGCNSAVDRPAVGETRIKSQTKLDNLVHIGHNCQIGESCALAAQVGLAGGVKIGNRVLLGGQVGAANNVEIGNGAIATAQTGITGKVKDGEIVSGSPSVANKIYLKASAIYKKLPEMYELFKQIQKQQKKEIN